MHVPLYREMGVVVQGGSRLFQRKALVLHETQQDLRNFHIQKMWCVQPLSRRKGDAGDGLGTLGLQEQRQDCRGVQHDQRLSRS